MSWVIALTLWIVAVQMAHAQVAHRTKGQQDPIVSSIREVRSYGNDYYYPDRYNQIEPVLQPLIYLAYYLMAPIFALLGSVIGRTPSGPSYVPSFTTTTSTSSTSTCTLSAVCTGTTTVTRTLTSTETATTVSTQTSTSTVVLTDTSTTTLTSTSSETITITTTPVVTTTLTEISTTSLTTTTTLTDTVTEQSIQEVTETVSLTINIMYTINSVTYITSTITSTLPAGRTLLDDEATSDLSDDYHHLNEIPDSPYDFHNDPLKNPAVDKLISQIVQSTTTAPYIDSSIVDSINHQENEIDGSFGPTLTEFSIQKYTANFIRG